jgi:hypothetical protein
MKIDLTDLAVALDHAEEAGMMDAPPPDPIGDPDGCVYLRRPSRAVAALFARLPSTRVQFRSMGGRGHNKRVRPVYNLDAVLHVLRFLRLPESAWTPLDRRGAIRILSTVPKKYWKVVR